MKKRMDWRKVIAFFIPAKVGELESMERLKKIEFFSNL
jgi:hypothetical protein